MPSVSSSHAGPGPNPRSRRGSSGRVLDVENRGHRAAARERRPITAAPGAARPPRPRRRGSSAQPRPVPISVLPVPRPGTSMSTRSKFRRPGAGALEVRTWTRLVRELKRHEPGEGRVGELEREPTGAVEPWPPGESITSARTDAGRVGAGGRVLGQHTRQRVALELRDERERDAGVSARRLEQAPAGLELAGGLGCLDHRLRDAVFDRAGGVLRFELREDADRPGREAGEFDQRRVADEVEDARCERVSAHRPWPVGESTTNR